MTGEEGRLVAAFGETVVRVAVVGFVFRWIWMRLMYWWRISPTFHKSTEDGRRLLDAAITPKTEE